MRITCSRCKTVYEADDTIASASGHAVRCTGCGHVWRKAETAPETGRAASTRSEGGNPQEKTDSQLPKRSRPSTAVLQVLREEAEREVKARKDDAKAAQAAPDSESVRHAERPETSRQPAASDRVSTAPRSNASVKNKVGTRTGLGGGTLLSALMILTALASVLVYSFAPQIVQLMPIAEPHLIAYVESANELRAMIKATIGRVLGPPVSGS